MTKNSLNWSSIENQLPLVDIFSDKVIIHNFRDFSLRSPTDYDERYTTVEILFDSIVSVSYVVIPFKIKFPPGGAHIFVSFEFKDREPIIVSFEARRLPTQDYNPILALFPYYPLAGMIGALHDVVTIRKKFKKDTIYFYKLDLTHDQLKNFFIALMEDVNRFNKTRKYHNALFNMCLTRIVANLNKVLPQGQKINWGIKTMFPAYSPALFLEKKIVTETQPKIVG